MADWFYSNEGTRSGPYSDSEMRQFATGGRFNDATLCWTASFGESWKPVAETEFRGLAPAPMLRPPPVPVLPPPARGSRPALFAIGGCALALVLLIGGLALFRSTPGSVATNTPAPAVTPRGPAPAVVPSQAGLSPAPAPSPAPASPDNSAPPQVADVESNLPKCSSARGETEVKRFADTLDSLVSAGIKSVGLSDQQQVSSAADKRNCKATMLLTDQSQHSITYSFETLPNGGFYVRIALKILPTCPSTIARDEVMRLANTLRSLTSTGRTASALSDQAEVSATDALRTCKGTLTISDGSRHDLTYSFEQRPTDVYASINVQ